MSSFDSLLTFSNWFQTYIKVKRPTHSQFSLSIPNVSESLPGCSSSSSWAVRSSVCCSRLSFLGFVIYHRDLSFSRGPCLGVSCALRYKSNITAAPAEGDTPPSSQLWSSSSPFCLRAFAHDVFLPGNSFPPMLISLFSSTLGS